MPRKKISAHLRVFKDAWVAISQNRRFVETRLKLAVSVARIRK